ncbi:MAG: Tripartite tricarboxylate transporter TctB family [Clostridiales bacterium]|jgi:hypothetical protein|nr:Tripartite tricarboxylate transporter TctB family [Clostridiales bacterium]
MRERIISSSIFIFAIIYLAGSVALSVGNFSRPGAGFLPTGIAAALLLVSAFNVYKAFKSGKENNEDNSWRRMEPIVFAVCIIMYPIILRPFSYIISTFILLAVCLRLLKYKNLVISLAIALGTSFFSYWLFSNILGVVLPTGFLEEIIQKL